MLKYKNIKIFKRKDNYYEAKWQRNYVRKSVYGKTQKECYEKLKIELNKKPDPKLVIEKSITLDKWLEEWLQTYKSHLKSKEYFYVINKYVNNKITKPLNQIKPIDLQRIINLAEGSRTQQSIYNILNQAIKQAFINKLIKSNIMEGINKPKHKRILGQALTIEEENTLLNMIAGNTMENLIKFYLYSGARRSEVLNLKWKDIDFKNNTVHLKGTKTESSDRIIPIFPKLKNILTEIKMQPPNNFIFEFKPNTVTQYFTRLNINNHSLHDLRHTFATRCIEKGISMKTVQIWLGHSNYKTTANIYSHIDNKHSQEQAKLLE